MCYNYWRLHTLEPVLHNRRSHHNKKPFHYKRVAHHVIFVFSFVDVLYHIDLFTYPEQSFWSWDESNLIIVYDPFYLLLGSVSFFFGKVFVWFCYSGDSDFIKWLWECSFLFRLLEKFENDRYKFFVCLNSPVKLLSTGLLCSGRFIIIITDSVSVLVFSLFKLCLFLIWFAGCRFLDTCALLLHFPFCCHRTVHNMLW